MLRRFVILAASLSHLPAQPRSPVDTAWELVAKGDRAQAVQVLQQFIQTNPGNGDARLLLGSILTESGDYPAAILHLTEGVRLLPRKADAHNALGEAQIAAGDDVAGEASFRKSIALDGKFAQPRINLAVILLKNGNPKEAGDHLDRALTSLGRSPEAAHPLYLRGKVYSETDAPEKAVAVLKQAVALQPDFEEAWSDLGEAQKVIFDDDAAFAAYRRSVELNPDNAVSQYRLGAEYLRRGDAHQAVSHLQQAFRLDPENQSTANSLQLALRKDGQTEEADRVKGKLTEILRKIDKESQDAFNALRLNNEGAELEKAGDLKAATEKYRAALMLDPKHVGIRVNFAVALLRQAEWADGLRQLREAARRDPNNQKIKAALADALDQAPPQFGGNGKAPSPATRR